MLRGWKTYLGIAGAALTAVAGYVAGELDLVQLVVTLFSALGVAGIRAKLGRAMPEKGGPPDGNTDRTGRN